MKMLENEFYHKFPDNLMFNYCMILAAEYYQHDLKFYPVSWREDDQVSNVKMVSQATKVLQMLFEYLRDPVVICKEYREKRIEKYEADVIA